MLKGHTKVMMVIVAIVIDIIQGIITVVTVGTVGSVVSPMITVIGQLLFWFWFRINGIDYLGSRRVAYAFFGSIIEVIPIVDVLAAFTVEIILMLMTLKVEEKIEEKVPGGNLAVSTIKARTGGVQNPRNIREATQFFKNPENTRSFKETYRTFKVNNSAIAQPKQNTIPTK